MARRAPETLADYLVVAICPTLIALLVGSLMWFLVEVFYQGDFKWRLLWVMAMFVIAIVGIARISMEEGLAYASLFAVPLAGAVAMALMSFVADGLVVGGPLMLLVWWAAHKLTWDATLIDDTQDASGEGLLEHMGLDAGSDATRPSQLQAGVSRPPLASPLEGTSANELQPDPPWWERILEHDKRPHAPGVWVVYFSLAALPIFGLGGWFVPATDPVARARTFGLLVIYVASGLGLLLATSFLGLRRYLRQRKLQMPLEMTSTWLIVGVVMICAMLLLATILPRPHREQSLSQLPVVVTSAARKASRMAFGQEGTKDDTNKEAAKTTSEKAEGKNASGETRAKGSATSQQPGGKRGETNQGQAQGKGDSASSKEAKDGGKSQAQTDGKPQGRSSEADRERQQVGEQADGNKNPREPASEEPARQDRAREQQPGPSQDPPREDQPTNGSRPRNPAEILSQAPAAILRHLGTALRWLFYAALVVGLLIVGVVYREQLAAAWRKLLDELRELWDRWFGVKNGAAAPGEVALAPPALPGFASYADPFLTGAADRMHWPQLVSYSFQALEAWGREHNCARADGQTPHEFAIALSEVDSDVGRQAAMLAGYYGQLAYASRGGSSGPKDALRGLWVLLGERKMTQVGV